MRWKITFECASKLSPVQLQVPPPIVLVNLISSFAPHQQGSRGTYTVVKSKRASGDAGSGHQTSLDCKWASAGTAWRPGSRPRNWTGNQTQSFGRCCFFKLITGAAVHPSPGGAGVNQSVPAAVRPGSLSCVCQGQWDDLTEHTFTFLQWLCLHGQWYPDCWSYSELFRFWCLDELLIDNFIHILHVPEHSMIMT